MSHVPQVSIWVPSYNHARFLPAALDSALAQTFGDFEVVLVDDGSADDSLAVAEAYAARHPSKVRVFTHPGRRNRGISETVNLAHEKSRGRYFCGLPSDDLLRPDKLEVQVAFLERNPEVGWVYGPVSVVDEAGRALPEHDPIGADITRDPNPLESLILRNVVPGPSVLMRREAVERAGPHDPSLLYSDWHFWVRMSAHARAAYLERPLVDYRVHTRNTSVGIDPRANMRSGLEVMRALRRDAPGIGGGLAAPGAQALLDVQVAYHHYCLDETDEATAGLEAALKTDPGLASDLGRLARWVDGCTLYDRLDFAAFVAGRLRDLAGEGPAGEYLALLKAPHRAAASHYLRPRWHPARVAHALRYRLRH